MPVVTEPRRENMVGHTKVAVSFNPTVAGEYCIAVAVNGRNVGGEVYRRIYKPGPLDPLKTTTGVQNEIFIVKKDEHQTVKIIPRDRFGNIIQLTNNSILMEIRRIILHDEPNVFSVNDGGGMSLKMSSEGRERIAATYHRFILSNSGNSISFTDKQTCFNERLKQHHFGNEDRDSFTRVLVSRQELLQSAMEATKMFKKDDWLKLFVVQFIGEQGSDAGGLSREFFELLTEHCFSSKSGMFKAVDDSPQALVHPCRTSLRSQKIDLSYYKFAGQVVGKCILECALGKPLLAKARFTRSFLVQILGLNVTSQCLKADDPQIYNAITDNSVEGLDLFFVDTDYDSSHVLKEMPLKKKGQSLPVTDENKMEYLNLLTEYRMVTAVKSEIAAFIEGFSELIPEDLLIMFDEQELEFVTGSSRLPARGFADLSYPIRVRSLDGQHGKLPSAATCIPDEVVCVIFGYLPAQSKFFLRLTCRRLFRIGGDPSLWKVISLSHVTSKAEGMLRSMLSLASQTLRSLRIMGDCVPSKYWNEVLKCRFLETLEVYGAKLTVAQLKRLVGRTRALSSVGFDVGMYGAIEFREYLSIVRELPYVMVRMYTKRQGVGLQTDVITTWAKQGYSPRQLAVVDLDAYAADYTPHLLMDALTGLHLPGCAIPSAVLKVYVRNVMPLDLLPTPPIMEVHVDLTGTIQIARTYIFSDINVPVCLSTISEKALNGRYCPGGFNQQKPCYTERPFSLIAASLVHLDLTNMKSLLPEHLLHIGHHCCNLKQLVLDSCDKCLSSLDGIKEVALRCPLKGLSVTGIMKDSVPCTAELWDSISSMPVLTHLIVEGCLLQPEAPQPVAAMKTMKGSDSACRHSLMPHIPVETSQLGISLQRLKNLAALEVQCFTFCSYCKRLTDDHLGVLSHLMGLVYLRVKRLPPFHYTKWLTAVFTNCPDLKYVYISNTHGSITLPTDPTAYTNLEQFFFESPDQQLSQDCVNALISAGKLTHLFLILNSMNADVVLKLAHARFVLVSLVKTMNLVKTMTSAKTMERYYK
eukprot:Em0003g1513a